MVYQTIKKARKAVRQRKVTKAAVRGGMTGASMGAAASALKGRRKRKK